MSDMLTIGSSAVAAYQRALGTVSNNIANVGTEGYVRQETSMAENMPRQQGKIYLGTGVSVAGIKRAYDQFLEQNLRNSTSEMNTQGPMVDYGNRILDIMGSDTVGLPPALDKFFGTARQLSVDPASTILRGQFLRDADGLASRFRELSTQMQGVDTETREAIASKVADINTLAGQIATVNKQLAGKPFADRQPPDLLDQRDLLLTKLSKLVKINVSTAVNGSVGVSIGNVSSGGQIVNGDRSVTLVAKFDETDLSRVSIIADPYGKTPEEIVGISSGELGGLMGFREQVLQPTFASLDFLATTVAEELNQIHRNGIDSRGEVGQDLFRIAPVIQTDPATGKRTEIDRPAAGIFIAIEDTAKVAAGALFRVIENENNLSNVDATLSYTASYPNPSTVRPLSQVLKNNANPSAGIAAPRDLLLGQIPLGSNNWSLFMDGASEGQQLQVFTRDGRQLLGGPIIDDVERRALMTTANGFIPGSTYSTDYLNLSGDMGYKQMSSFYGLISKPIEQYDSATRFTPEHNVLPSSIPRDTQIGEEIPAGLTEIAADRLTINGRVLPRLLPTSPAQTIQASDMAAWMMRATQDMSPPIGVNALTTTPELEIDPEAGLFINGIAIAAESARTLTELVDLINGSLGNETNVVAALDDTGTKLILSNADGYGGDDIRIGTMDADGKLVTQTDYKGKLNFGADDAISIGYGAAGQAGDLDLLGIPLGTYSTSLYPTLRLEAGIESARIPSTVDAIAADTLTINGVALGGLDLGRRLSVPDMVNWINATGTSLDPQVFANGFNEIRVPAATIESGLTKPLYLNGVQISGSATGGSFASAEDLAAAISMADTGRVVASLDTQSLTKGLEINGVVLTGSESDGSFTNRADIVTKINLATASTGVTATMDGLTSEIVLTTEDGEDIVIGDDESGNALGVTSGTYSKIYAQVDTAGNLILGNGSGADIRVSTLTGGSNALGLGNGSFKGQLTLASEEEIRLGFTEEQMGNGPAELAKLGLRTGAYIDGAVTEDLLVFVSAGSATIAGSYDATMSDPATLNEARLTALRAEKYDIQFTDSDQYQITWTNPANGLVTVLAERTYDPMAGIEYRGLKLTLNGPPAAGDKFVIDGNQDGKGNNQNMLDIIALERKAVIGGVEGKTISQAYIEEVGKVGNFSSQASIAQKALQVVNDQAIEARDKVSGVTLDGEAADLIRFQQAYQAAAKTIQVAGTLFDSILQASR
jgi:flagellar hook-associated protein FlgK